MTVAVLQIGSSNPKTAPYAIGEMHDPLSELALLDRNALTQRWAEVYGCPAPRNCQATLMRSALAWHCQMEHKASPGKNGDAERMIRGLRREVASATPKVSLAPGTRLLREWQGKTHHVTVLAQGFEYSEKTYRSLTAIARLITGTPWSGPLFFGLRS